jgi:hypothetical protein
MALSLKDKTLLELGRLSWRSVARFPAGFFANPSKKEFPSGRAGGYKTHARPGVSQRPDAATRVDACPEGRLRGVYADD